MKGKLKIINKEISRIKKEEDVKVIIAVGSGKDMVLKAQGISKVDERESKEKQEDNYVVNFTSREKKNIAEDDIDLFIITRGDESNQLRQIKQVENIEFDLNYFSRQVAESMLDRKFQFFMEELKDGRIVYDPEGLGAKYITRGREIHESGPPFTARGNLAYLKYNLQSKLKRIVRLEGGNEDSQMEFYFLSNLWLKDLLVYYFRLNGLWIPKDKKMFSIVKEHDELLYEKIKNFNKQKDSKILKDIAGYVFYEDGIKLGDEMRFKFKF